MQPGLVAVHLRTACRSSRGESFSAGLWQKQHSTYVEYRQSINQFSEIPGWEDVERVHDWGHDEDGLKSLLAFVEIHLQKESLVEVTD